MTRGDALALAGGAIVCLILVCLYPVLGGLLLLAGLFVVLFCALAAVIL